MINSELQKRVKDLRKKQGLSQEELAEKSGLSLRTIQRIENGESIPRGDTLKRLSISLKSTPDDLIDWQIHEDSNVLKVLSFSQLGFLFFPLLGIIIPLTVWIWKKDKIKYVDIIGKSIINFQISWNLVLFVFNLIILISMIFFGLRISPFSGIITVFLVTGLLYSYNLITILINTFIINKYNKVKYMPAIKILS